MTKSQNKPAMELYKENGEKAGLYDICKWWIETYPPDIFIENPKPVVEARICMQNILLIQEARQEVSSISTYKLKPLWYP